MSPPASERHFHKTLKSSVCFLYYLSVGEVSHTCRGAPPVLTAQVGRPLVVDHPRGQRAVVGRRGAEQDVVGHGLVQHGAVRAGVGRALAVAAHALVRQRPVEGASGGQAVHRRHLGEGRAQTLVTGQSRQCS